MNMLILTEEKVAALEILNALGEDTRRLEAVELTNGNAALGADLLTDCAPGQTWDHYEQFLNGLPIEAVDPSQFVEESIQ
jgi:hypothetical protein